MKQSVSSSNNYKDDSKNRKANGDVISREFFEHDENITTAQKKIFKREQLSNILGNLTDVETALQSVLQTHRHGEYGFVTREWGFTAPGGLGGQLKGKFYPWELKLLKCKSYFWPIECYEAMEQGPDFGRPDYDMIKDLPPEAEQLYGNTPLHLFLKEAPSPAVELLKDDYQEYRSAARIFLLLGTLSHLYGNSAPGGPKTAALPSWIEEPLLEVAERLQIEPTLSGHFLVQENWVWKSDVDQESTTDDILKNPHQFQKRSSIVLSKRRWSKNSSQRMERIIIRTILRECKCEDRFHRIKMNPDCFLGSQCVDVVMHHRFADAREEAVRLLRKINRAYNLFMCVTDNNYELMDKRFFYRFRKEWDSRRFMALRGELLDSSIEVYDEADDEDRSNRFVSFGPTEETIKNNLNLKRIRNSQVDSILRSNVDTISSLAAARFSSNYNGPRVVPSKHTSIYDSTAIIDVMAKVRVKDRRYRLRLYNKCFIGKQLIDMLLEHECGSTRRECLELALSINQRYMLFEHVKSHHLLKDKYLFYRFTDSFRNMVEEQTHVSTLVEAGGGGNLMPRRRSRVSFSDQTSRLSFNTLHSAEAFTDENRQPSYSDYGDSYDAVLGLEDEMEFSLDNITMLYPAFGNNHERINQLVPACMGFSLSSLPFDVLDILSAMRNVLEAELNSVDDEDNYEINRLYDLLYKVAFSVSKCKEEFQQMSTDPKKRTYNSKYVSIKQTQPLSNGVLVRRSKDAEPTPAKGTTGTQFPYFHILDWLLGRFQYKIDEKKTDRGLVAAVGSIDNTFPRPQREYIRCLYELEATSSLRGFLEIIGRPKQLLTAYNHLIECYAGEGGVLQAHCRKLYSYIHNNVQSSTSGTNHLASSKKEEPRSKQPSSSDTSVDFVDNERKESSKRKQSTIPGSLSSNEASTSMDENKKEDSKSKQSSKSLFWSLPSNETLNSIDIKRKEKLISKQTKNLVSFNEKSNAMETKTNVKPRSMQSEHSGCPMSASFNESPNNVTDDKKEDVKSKHPRISGCPMTAIFNESNKIDTNQNEIKGNEFTNSGCPMSLSSNESSNSIDNHKFAITMFKHMRMAANDRWKLRLPPLMNEVGKIIYSTSESGGFTTVALDLSDTGLLYEYGDVVKVLLPNDDKQTLSWVHSLQSMNKEFFKMEDMTKFQKSTGNGWGWDGLWEALGWYKFEESEGSGVPLKMIARYIEQGNIRDELSNKPRWVHSPLDLSKKRSSQVFASPPPISAERIVSLEPVSPRIYSVSGVEIDRVFLLVSKPDDLARHHGYSSMSDPKITKVHCSFSPATFFLLPPKDINLVCIASGTGISPFVGLVDAIGSRTGSYTIVHQCKSSDMFMCNSQTWLDFTAMNPCVIVMGYISGDRSRRNCPMRYVIRNGAFEETTVLRRRRICAYYFECETFKSRIFETYKSDGMNLAYCCGGVKSAIMPLQAFAESNGMEFEFTCESYGVPSTLTKGSNLLSQIGGTIIDLNHVSPIHTGGDQILHQANDILINMARIEGKKISDTPDHSLAFYELHPHAYNLHRCLRTPVDADSKAFAKFLERQAMSKSVLGNMATKYAQAVLSAPESSKILKIATELQSSAITAQLGSGDTEGAKKAASYLKQLLDHVPDDDDDAERWGQSLDLLPPNRRKSSVVLKLQDSSGDDHDEEKWGQSLDLLPPSRRKSSVVMKIPDISDDDNSSEKWEQSFDLLPPRRRKSSLVMKISNIQDDDKHEEKCGQSLDLLPLKLPNMSDGDNDEDKYGQSFNLLSHRRRKRSVIMKIPES